MTCKKLKKENSYSFTVVKNIIGSNLNILDKEDYDTDRLRIKGDDNYV